MTQKILIPLTPRTKKNHSRIIFNKYTGKPQIIQSKDYIQYERDCAPFLKNVEPFLDPCIVKCLFYMPTHRRVDLSNLLAAISDILVKYGILIDDNSEVIKGYDGSRVLYDKNNGHTIIEISEWKEDEE